MNRELLKKIVDATVSNDDDALSEAVKVVMLEKMRERVSGEQPLTEVGNVKITNNDVFVSGKKVGSVNIDDDDSVVEFTDTDGNSKEFEDIDAFHDHLSKVFESPEDSKRVKDKALKKGTVKSNAGDGEVGDYKKHDPRSSLHKDGRMDNPKKHDHGHDDKSGVDYKKKEHKKSADLPEDKKHSLRYNLHKDDKMENPKGHDHGHDDESGVNHKATSQKSGSNPPDKQHDTRKSAHKDDKMENPKKHDHGHDSPQKEVRG